MKLKKDWMINIITTNICCSHNWKCILAFLSNTSNVLFSYFLRQIHVPTCTYQKDIHKIFQPYILCYNRFMQELGLFKDFIADYFNGKVHVNKIVKKYAVVLVDVFTQAMTWITHNSITKIEKTLEYYNTLISLLAMIVDVNGWYMWFLPWKETINKSPTLRYEFAFLWTGVTQSRLQTKIRSAWISLLLIRNKTYS